MKHDTDMGLAFKNVWTFECFDSEQNLRWREEKNNRVVIDGLNAVLNISMRGDQGYPWYIGLKNDGIVSEGDTMSSHSGWTENVNFSQSERQPLYLGGAVNGSCTSSGSKAVFVINTEDTIKGAFITSSNDKGGTDGVLYGAVDFLTPRTVLTGDTLEIAVTLSASNG